MLLVSGLNTQATQGAIDYLRSRSAFAISQRSCASAPTAAAPRTFVTRTEVHDKVPTSQRRGDSGSAGVLRAK
jgi:hypothetical protein